MAIDHLVTLARVLNTTVDELLIEDDEDVVIRPRRDEVGANTFWLLTRPDDTSGRVVAKMRIPAHERLPEARIHPGRDWFYVLKGAVRLQLGTREVLVPTGQAASFNTMTPHSIGGRGGPAEILTILDHHGERAHLTPDSPRGGRSRAATSPEANHSLTHPRLGSLRRALLFDELETSRQRFGRRSLQAKAGAT